MLEDMDIDTGVDLDALIECAHLAQDIVGRELPGQVMRAGPHATWRHATRRMVRSVPTSKRVDRADAAGA